MTSYSQAGQDLWVWEMTERKKNGTYVDIGCNHASLSSNTYSLETESGWRGLLVDTVSGCEGRAGDFVQCDATSPNDRLIFHYSRLPPIVDYLSLDTDDALMGSFTAIPWHNTSFRLITLEHDVYRIGNKTRSQTRSLLSAMGYHLVCSDVMVNPLPDQPTVPFEDWWCMPELINPDLIKKYQCENLHWKVILKL